MPFSNIDGKTSCIHMTHVSLDVCGTTISVCFFSLRFPRCLCFFKLKAVLYCPQDTDTIACSLSLQFQFFVSFLKCDYHFERQKIHLQTKLDILRKTQFQRINMLVIALCLLVVTGANCELREPHPDIQRNPSDGRVEVNLGSEVILNFVQV